MSLAGFGGMNAVWIAAGLLIAFGLVLIARAVLRKFQKRRAWAMINAEREDNKSRFLRIAESFATLARQLKANSALLEPVHARGDFPQASLAGQVVWTCDFPEFIDSAWQTIRRNGLTSVMLPQQLHEVEELYTDFDILRVSLAKVQQDIEAANRHARAGFSDAGAQWLTDEIGLLQAIRSGHEKLGADMRHFHQQHTDFVPSV